jgi:hypothetical protein
MESSPVDDVYAAVLVTVVAAVAAAAETGTLAVVPAEAAHCPIAKASASPMAQLRPSA